MTLAQPNTVSFELQLVAHVSADIDVILISICCERLGIEIIDIIQRVENDTLFISIFSESAQEAQEWFDTIQTLHLQGVDVTLIEHQQQDWESKWKERWKPFALTERIDVVPAWQQDEYQAKGKEIILLDTVSAFGTGLHETTRFMAQFIDDHRGNIKTFFDIGCGTGILGIVAKLAGAEEVWAVDIDQYCMDVVLKNTKINNVTFDLLETSDVGSFARAKQFDFVAANLITEVLIEYADNIVSFVKPQGKLAISGISLQHLEELESVFKQLPLTRLDIKRGEKWAALLFQKH